MTTVVVTYPGYDDGDERTAGALRAAGLSVLFEPRTGEWGGEYGPYQIAHLTTPTPDGALVYFTMSTWNPYQVMVMRAELHAADLA